VYEEMLLVKGVLQKVNVLIPMGPVDFVMEELDLLNIEVWINLPLGVLE